jgi:hypothetical protein
MTNKAMYEDVKLTSDIRRKAEKIISSYRKIDALIQTLKMELPDVKLTPTYELKEGSGGGVSNTIEALYLKQEKIREEIAKNELDKKKLDIIYNSLNDLQKKIWEERYIFGRFDKAIMNSLLIRKETYYVLKNEIIILVARAFCLV